MNSVVFGIVLLLGLIGLKSGTQYFNVARTKKTWAGVQADLERGDFASAEKQITRCIKLMPLWLHPRFLLGAVLAKQGKLEDAEDALKMALALEPRQPQGHIELGIFYVTSANRLDDGMDAFQEALEHDPEAWSILETDPRLEAFRQTDAFAVIRAAMEDEED